MGEVVPMVKEGRTPIYRRRRQDGRYDKVWIDKVGKQHATGEVKRWPQRRPVKPLYWQHRIDQNVHRPRHDQKPEDWRMCGPEQNAFPASASWKTGDYDIDHNQGKGSIPLWHLTVHTLTQFKTMKKFEPPTGTEEAWRQRASGLRLPMKETWKIKCNYCTPRDQLTWLKVQHRNLYVQRDEDCLACGQHKERMLHLCSCSTLHAEFWCYFLTLLKLRKISIAPDQEVDMMLATGRISDEKVISDEASGVIFVAWRVLYAEIVSARMEDTRPNWKRAARRGIGLLINRMVAWGEYWRKWYKKIQNTSKAQLFPKDQQEHALISIDDSAHYTVAPELQQVYDSI